MECQTITTTTGALYPTGLLDAAGLPTTAYEISGKTGTLAAPAIASTTVNGLPCTSTATATQALLPYQLTENLAPYFYSNKEEDHAAFAQDQWRIKRLTLNLGLRFDWFQAGDPEQTVAAQPQYGLPAKSYAAENSVVDWKDLNPAHRGGLRPLWKRQDGHQGFSLAGSDYRREHRDRGADQPGFRSDQLYDPEVYRLQRHLQSHSRWCELYDRCGERHQRRIGSGQHCRLLQPVKRFQRFVRE